MRYWSDHRQLKVGNNITRCKSLDSNIKELYLQIRALSKTTNDYKTSKLISQAIFV